MEGSGRGTLADASEKEVNKLLTRVSTRKRKKNGDSEEPVAKHCTWNGKPAPKENAPSVCGAPAALPESSGEIWGKTAAANEDAEDDIEWETGAAQPGWDGQVTFEVEAEAATPSGGKRPARRRATAKDKEFAELVHKAHLLCLLARGRLVDAACSDPMLRASVRSIVPPRLIPSGDSESVTSAQLQSLAKWFSSFFRLGEGSVGARLSDVLAKQTGSEEEVAALAVATFRALGLSTRYVCVLDVTSLKPDPESLEASKDWNADNRRPVQKALSEQLDSLLSTAKVPARELNTIQAPAPNPQVEEEPLSASPAAEPNVVRKRKKTTETSSSAAKPQPARTRRRGDEEFELELARAIAATGASATISKEKASQEASPAQKQDTVNSSRGVNKVIKNLNTSHWSRKKGPLLHWAEVYCGSTESGRWIHVDAARAIVDGPQNVEACAGRLPVRYVVAFSSMGAKDVTRRYTSAWSKITGLRVEDTWWNRCIFPLRELEASTCPERSMKEDMELETKAYTEPLPTNQQAYKNHHLYTLERWLTRYQILYPKGPVIGCCGGNPVYPRSCVQDLHTKERWMREGFAVKQGEQPVKTIKSRHNASRKQTTSENVDGEDVAQAEESSLVHLYGKWQTESWEPPPVVNGIVPRNERGQIDVWSEKCIPAGAVHLRLPRLGPIAQNLKVDFAPAMVGFEIRQGRSVPVYEGIVVPEEAQDVILEAYMREEQQRQAQIERKKEMQAALRWRQLLRSVATRQRLRAAYEVDTAAAPPPAAEAAEQVQPGEDGHEQVQDQLQEHVHSFHFVDEQSWMKRCACGLEVEEM